MCLQVENAYCGSGCGAFRMQIIKGQIYIVGEQEGLQSRGRSVKMMLLQLQQRFGNQLPDVDVGAISTGDPSQVALFNRHCATPDL